MRIMIDTNIIVSAALFRTGQISQLLKKIVQIHDICICTFSIEELFLVVDRKFKSKKIEVDEFLKELSFELVRTPVVLDRKKAPAIRDENDYPIILSAIEADVDVLISGDKDFNCVECERPRLMTPAEFLEKCM